MSNSPLPVSNADRDRAEDQIRHTQSEVGFDIRDFPIDYLVEKFREELYYIPDYQRQYVWRIGNRCAFIESVILGLPIPMMFFAEMDDGRLEIVDGAQRMYTLESFMNDDLELERMEKLTSLIGFRYSSLPTAQQRKFAGRPMRVVILDERTTVELRYELFKRINTRGERARPSEIRKGAFAGPFMSFLKRCAENKLFKTLCPITESLCRRREPEELMLRFFAYSDRYHQFRHDVNKFLDRYAQESRMSFDEGRLEREFQGMLHFVQKFFPHGFGKSRDSRATPRVRFEAISVGVNLALRRRSDLVPTDMSWLRSRDFVKHTTTHASNSLARLRGRVEYVRDRLLEVSK